MYETLATIRGTSAIVADSLSTPEGPKPLTTDGAFKLIIPGDKRPQRWVQNLKSLTFKTSTRPPQRIPLTPTPYEVSSRVSHREPKDLWLSPTEPTSPSFTPAATYSRPVALGNTLHFFVMTMTLLRFSAHLERPPLVLVPTAFSLILTVWFGLVLFGRSPNSAAK